MKRGKALTIAERKEILVLLKKKTPVKKIAEAYGRSVHTIYKIKAKNKKKPLNISEARPKAIKEDGKPFNSDKVKSVWRYTNKAIEVVGEVIKVYENTYLLQIDQQSQNAILRAGYLNTCEKVVVRQKDTRLIVWN